ncbi:MAG: hypothetical protein HY455_01990 [Parcubacteria group bacterium]|nr:hypothetical protein [Parcubacteria group bacterium]
MTSRKQGVSPGVMAFYHQDGLPAAWQQATKFAGPNGRLATMPDIIAARINSKPGDPAWETYFTTLTAEYLGISKDGSRILIVAHGIGPMSTLAGIQKAYSWEYKDKGRNRRGGRITQQEFLKLEAGNYGPVCIIDFDAYCKRYEYPFGGTLRASQALLDPVLKARHGPRHAEYIRIHVAAAREWHREQNGFDPENRFQTPQPDFDRFLNRRRAQHWIDGRRDSDPHILQVNDPANCAYTFVPFHGHREIEDGYALAHLITTGALCHLHHGIHESLTSDLHCHEWGNGVRLVGIKESANLESGVHAGPEPRALVHKYWRDLLVPVFPPDAEPGVGFRALMQMGDQWFTQYLKMGERMDTYEPEYVVTSLEKVGDPVLFRTTVGGYHGFFKFGINEVQAIAPASANAYVFVSEPQNEWSGGNPTHQTCMVQFYRAEADTTKRVIKADTLAYDLDRMMALLAKESGVEEKKISLEELKTKVMRIIAVLKDQKPQLNQSIPITALIDEAEKLLALLNDPQPGLMSWHDLVHERLEKLKAHFGRDLV